MAIDEGLARHVRAALASAADVREVKMFGGLGFMLNGNMVAACSDRGLLVRVGEPGMPEARARGAQPMVMNGREMTGYARVSGALDGRVVKSWLSLARGFVETLPPKSARKKPASGKKRAAAKAPAIEAPARAAAVEKTPGKKTASSSKQASPRKAASARSRS